jgi:hypothetical protein
MRPAPERLMRPAPNRGTVDASAAAGRRLSHGGTFFAAALLVCVCSAARAETWHYQVALDPAEPLMARVLVELPAAHRAQDFSVQVRGMAAGLTPQVTELRCDGVPLAPDSASAWRVQGWTCVRLTWKVPINTAAGNGVVLRAGDSFFDPTSRSWLFSEATSLLRPVDDPRHDGEVEFSGGGPVHGGMQVGRATRRLVPSADQPFEFFAVGKLPGASLREGSFEVSHLDALGIDWRDVLAEHGRALRYLSRTAGSRDLATLHSTVVWLGGPDDDSVPLGVAGFRTLLLSVAVRNGRLQHGERALAWMLREQLRQAIPERLPLWVRESLAQYYAIKALRRSELSPAAVAAVERGLIDSQLPPRTTLREAQRRAQSGDAAARADLHLVGAAFWDRVDRAIVRRSGFRTLDSLLPQLLAAGWTDDRLPPALLDRLRDYAGDNSVDELLAQYVGD